MVFKTILLAVFTGFTFSAFGQVDKREFNHLAHLQGKEQRLVVVFIETNWCMYCKAMKMAIQKDTALSNILNKQFYSFFLDAETQQTLRLGAKDFNYKLSGINTGVHELAVALGSINGQLSYPTICILNTKNEIIYQHPGYFNAKDLFKLLNHLTSENSVN